MTEEKTNEQLGEDLKILEEITNATHDLAVFLKLHDIEVDYWEADWKDGQELAEGVRTLCLRHPGWSMYYFGGDTWGTDSNYVFFTSKPVEVEVVVKVGENIVVLGAELPQEVIPPKPKCPKCGKEIDGLGANWRAEGIPGYASVVDGELYTNVLDGIKVYELTIEDSAVYFCPECEAELFKAGQEAEMTAFLLCDKDYKGEEEEKPFSGGQCH